MANLSSNGAKPAEVQQVRAVESDGRVIFLRQPSAYPHAPKRVDVVETHMSWVFLTDHYAYKLKKAVKYAFLDFSSIEARRRDCEEEVRLNRRLAPEVYLGIVPLTRDAAGLHLGGHGEIVDWLVVMHRLPGEKMLDSALQHAAVSEVDLRAVARVLTEFYTALEPIRLAPEQYRKRILQDVQANADGLLTPGLGMVPGDVHRVVDAQLTFLERAGTLLEQRVREGRILEAHGDLRPEHVCLVSPPQIIDCLEFNRDFRILDVADELAFLAMECERLGAPFVGPVLFAEYGNLSGDRPPLSLVHFYASSRACLRAKLAVWHLKEPEVRTPEKWPRQARQYLALAAHHARKLRPRSLEEYGAASTPG